MLPLTLLIPTERYMKLCLLRGSFEVYSTINQSLQQHKKSVWRVPAWQPRSEQRTGECCHYVNAFNR